MTPRPAAAPLPRQAPSGPRGYVLLLVIMLSMLLSMAALALIQQMGEGARTTGDVLQRKKIFYQTDGSVRGAVHLASVYLQGNPDPAPGDLQTWFETSNTDLGGVPQELLTPPGLSRQNFEVERLAAGQRADIPNGPFAGMSAHQTPITVSVQLRNPLIETSSRQQSTVVTGQVSMFQFFAFIDGYAYLYTGTGARFAGRVHANGNICVGSGGGIYLEKVTSAGSIYLAGSRSMDGCRDEGEQHGEGQNVFIATAPLSAGITGLNDDSNFLNMNAGGVHYDRDGAANGADIDETTYRDELLNRYNEQILDQAMGVNELKLPVLGDPIVHQGRNADHEPELNNENSRLVVDPIVPFEPEDVREQKLAYQADIRIINGAWYLKDEDNPERPGTPLWSDHPLSYTTSAEEIWAGSPQAVGQKDLFDGERVPLRYSYYATDVNDSLGTGDLHALLNEPSSLGVEPVVSYGTLYRDSGTGAYRPGYFHYRNGTGSRWQVDEAGSRGELLQAARSGFRDGWAEVGTRRNDDNERENLGFGDFDYQKFPLGNHLPMNINIQALKAALADTAENELGSYFDGSREFNGIVYITHTWPGWDVGMADDSSASTAPYWPLHGRHADCKAGAPTTDCQPLGSAAGPTPDVDDYWDGSDLSNAYDDENRPYQQALPYPLCSDDTNRLAWHDWLGSHPTSPEAGDDHEFFVTHCDRYTDTSLDPDDRLHARVNSVRVYNGGDFTGPEFEGGLTIASNLPVFVLGDYNETSTPSEVPGTTHAGWRPAMVAGDTVSILSNNWQDALSPWNLTIRRNESDSHRPASDTTYHFQILAGWLVSAGGSRDEVTYFTRLLEDWNDVGRDIRGSIVIGFNSQYGIRFHWDTDNSRDNSTDKFYLYDYHLDALDNQPPGAPTYTVNAVRSWRRD